MCFCQDSTHNSPSAFVHACRQLPQKPQSSIQYDIYGYTRSEGVWCLIQSLNVPTHIGQDDMGVLKSGTGRHIDTNRHTQRQMETDRNRCSGGDGIWCRSTGCDWRTGSCQSSRSIAGGRWNQLFDRFRLLSGFYICGTISKEGVPNRKLSPTLQTYPYTCSHIVLLISLFAGQ